MTIKKNFEIPSPGQLCSLRYFIERLSTLNFEFAKHWLPSYSIFLNADEIFHHLSPFTEFCWPANPLIKSLHLH